MERGTVRGEHDQVIREHDKAQQRISSLQVKLDITKVQKLEAEGAATGLAKDLTKTRSVL